jgi:hypothetical protein
MKEIKHTVHTRDKAELYVTRLFGGVQLQQIAGGLILIYNNGH